MTKNKVKDLRTVYSSDSFTYMIYKVYHKITSNTNSCNLNIYKQTRKKQ